MHVSEEHTPLSPQPLLHTFNILLYFLNDAKEIHFHLSSYLPFLFLPLSYGGGRCLLRLVSGLDGSSGGGVASFAQLPAISGEEFESLLLLLLGGPPTRQRGRARERDRER